MVLFHVLRLLEARMLSHSRQTKSKPGCQLSFEVKGSAGTIANAADGISYWLLRGSPVEISHIPKNWFEILNGLNREKHPRGKTDGSLMPW